MASKAKSKTFTVGRRFDVYVDMDIPAESLEQALEIRDTLKLYDMITPVPRAQIVDWEDLPGGGVYESY